MMCSKIEMIISRGKLDQDGLLREMSAKNKLNEMLAEAEAGNFPKKNFENCGKMFG